MIKTQLLLNDTKFFVIRAGVPGVCSEFPLPFRVKQKKAVTDEPVWHTNDLFTLSKSEK